ncbi:MAG: NAD(P)/FAD-dependent oxidoreductase [Myxococcales bacterium]|nr:NAD(P)/FAD-dependent oxidoreductase [Myxococcales bacterium]
MAPEHLDVVIVGAGLSGVAAAYHLQKDLPRKTYAILEARHTMGGTWDLFRYPGVRSDSDMYTLGYSFKPWREPKAIADGDSILAYIKETAAELGIDKHVRYHHRVEDARWSSADARWHLVVRKSGELVDMTCSFLILCSGYYDYESGYTPKLPGIETFKGRVVHPQKWTPDIDYTGKRVVVIGSGATAVTLVPELAKKAAHVTMLQRSPTYIVTVPAKDPIADWLRAKLPEKLAHGMARWKNVLFGMAFFNISRRWPKGTARWLIKQADKQLEGSADVKEHFTPSYDPWDQRLCLIPDADLFKAIKDGTASVVTDHIETFDATGIRLKSGKHLDADLVVTATGLNLKVFGGIRFSVDGKPVDAPSSMIYKGLMVSGVPNLAFAVGYTNASWTLKADLTAQYVGRLLAFMDKHGYTYCVPERDPGVAEEPLMNFTSGYVQRSIAQFPKQGNVRPWKLFQNYALDLLMIRHSKIDDRSIRFG